MSVASVTREKSILDKRSEQRNTIGTAYDVIDILRERAGIVDLTEGMYETGQTSCTPQCYHEAQTRKADWILDQIGCQKGSSIIDIGCGNGPILERAKKRGAIAIGITLSQSQVDYCRNKGLYAKLLHYRNMPDAFGKESFDGAVCAGALEHFVHPEQANLDDGDEIYREMFQLVRYVLRSEGRFVTTAIHFRRQRQIEPDDIIKKPTEYIKGSPVYHFSRVFLALGGGWYPYPGQLEKCAREYFCLVGESDGTEDYYHTSRYWTLTMRRTLLNPLTLISLSQKLLRYRKVAIEQLRLLITENSWIWQFRKPAPTILYRHTWKRL